MDTALPSKRHVRMRIERALMSLPPSERRVAETILQAPDRAVDLTIMQLAHVAKVSVASVTRLCQSLGYRGTHEFMIHLARDLSPSTQPNAGEFATLDTAESVRDRLVRAVTDSLADTAKLVDGALLQQCADVIAPSRRIELYGIGASAAVAQDAAHKFLKLGLRPVAYSDVDLMAIGSASLGEGDVAIGVSHTGRTRPVVEAVMQARDAGAATVALTHDGSSPLAQAAQMTLTYAARRTPLSNGSMAGRLAQLILIDILYTLVAQAEFDRRTVLVERADRLAGRRRHD